METKKDNIFFERLLLLCLEKKQSYTTTMRSLGIASATFQNWKKGHGASGEQLLVLSKHFGCSVDYLLGLTDNRNNQAADKKDDSLLDIILKNKDKLQALKIISKFDDSQMQTLMKVLEVISQLDSKEN